MKALACRWWKPWPVVARWFVPIRDHYQKFGGQAVAYFDPYKKGDLEKVLKKVWEDKNLRKELAQKGLAQAKKFSWSKCAQETLNVYQGIINNEKLSKNNFFLKV